LNERFAATIGCGMRLNPCAKQLSDRRGYGFLGAWLKAQRDLGAANGFK